MNTNRMKFVVAVIFALGVSALVAERAQAGNACETVVWLNDIDNSVGVLPQATPPITCSGDHCWSGSGGAGSYWGSHGGSD